MYTHSFLEFLDSVKDLSYPEIDRACHDKIEALNSEARRWRKRDRGRADSAGFVCRKVDAFRGWFWSPGTWSWVLENNEFAALDPIAKRVLKPDAYKDYVDAKAKGSPSMR